MVSEVAPQALAKLAMAAPQALAIATATLHAMATAAAGGDTATGDVMAAMPMAMMAMLIPIAAVLHLQLWNARCGLRRTLSEADRTPVPHAPGCILQHKAEAIDSVGVGRLSSRGCELAVLLAVKFDPSQRQ